MLMSESQRKGPFFMLLASVCWSFGGLCIKFIPWDAMTIVGMRAFLAAIVFSIYRRNLKIKLTKGNMLAAICLSLTTILFVFANKMTTAAAAILLQFSAPIFIILIELFFYRKKPHVSETVAVIATVLGMVLFFADSLDVGGTMGNLLAIASGLSFAGVFVCNKRPDVIPEESLFLGFLVNSIIGLPFAFFGISANPIAWASIVFLGLVQVGLAYVFFSIGIQSTSALLACLITAIEPVLNPIWVAIATDEMPGSYAILGGTVIIASVIGYNVWTQRKQKLIE